MLEVTILMPCLNESATIEKCIEKAKGYLESRGITGEVLVIDNDSTDNSVELAKKAGARVETEKKKGYGNALITGIRLARGKYIIMGDSDDSYDFSDLDGFMEALREGTDLVVGNRYKGGIEKGAMPFSHRYFGNPVLSLLGRMLYPCKVRDFHCGLRGFDRAKMQSLKLQCGGMEFASEMIIKSRKAGFNIKEVPTRLYCDKRNGKSHLHAVRDGLRHLGVLFSNRPLVSCILMFLCAAWIGVSALTLINCIPQRAIEKNIEKSAQYYEEKPLFYNLAKDYEFTRVDNYADCILTNIIYSADTEKPFESAMRAGYYQGEMMNVNTALKKAVEEKLPANVDYFRYWHGSMVVLRPLFIFFSITGVRLVLGILMAAMAIGLLLRLWKNGYRTAAGITAFGFLGISLWMCAFSVEYITSIFVMLAGLFAVVRKERSISVHEKQADWSYIRLFSLLGILTCYVDFLTTESLTLTMPLLLIFMIRKEKDCVGRFWEEAKFSLKVAFSWGISYGMMFLTKWGISALLVGREAFGDAFGEAAYRIAGEVTSDNTSLGVVLNVPQQLIGTLWKNLKQLFCLPEGVTQNQVFAITGGVLIVLFAVWYLFRKKKSADSFFALVLLLALVPYVRFLALRNHSYEHCFFTYRAQMVTLAGIAAAMWYSVKAKRKKQ